MCGILGVVSNGEVSQKVVLGLYDLQHRGEQAAGMVLSNGKSVMERRGIGLVTEVFDDKTQEDLRNFSGRFGIGHTLYSTIGNAEQKEQPRTLQPLVGKFLANPFALSHNGNLIDLEKLRREAEEKGYSFSSKDSDTEVILALVSTSPEKDFLEAITKVLPRLKGSFSLIFLFGDKVIGIRDGKGIRPLCLGRDENSFILASEESAFKTMGARFIREVKPGELIVLGRNGIENSFIWANNPELKFCIFEFIYFARPDSRFMGKSVYSYRENAGRLLAREYPVQADIVCSVPDSGRIYNYGFAQELCIPLVDAIFRNRYYAKRTFMASRETDRRALQRRKLHVMRELVHGLRVVATEDSIIRANTSPEVVAMLREEGATEVHLRVGSSPICWPCFLGVDMSTRVELIASGLTVEEIGRKIIRADSLGYLSIEGMISATGLPRENFCLGCFTGDYPVEPCTLY